MSIVLWLLLGAALGAAVYRAIEYGQRRLMKSRAGAYPLPAYYALFVFFMVSYLFVVASWWLDVGSLTALYSLMGAYLLVGCVLSLFSANRQRAAAAQRQSAGAVGAVVAAPTDNLPVSETSKAPKVATGIRMVGLCCAVAALAIAIVAAAQLNHWVQLEWAITAVVACAGLALSLLGFARVLVKQPQRAKAMAVVSLAATFFATAIALWVALAYGPGLIEGAAGG
ncbi:hypothetical protein G7Y31_01795 [Corynebacterium lizhenjunii]|uniref:Uncharacterized protein n=1 Tax=Corynebacterium lizhenjunii TaxID=2709394 RepID=A0A7T0PBI0_9CORY|nr:hypothetical protein [Corynebacterium lizhenjunii]QPK79470.1 hypothetical protein G7Y31_01795 [Corynebacterium lizhenjunii]